MTHASRQHLGALALAALAALTATACTQNASPDPIGLPPVQDRDWGNREFPDVNWEVPETTTTDTAADEGVGDPGPSDVEVDDTGAGDDGGPTDDADAVAELPDTGGPTDWKPPSCNSITGTPALSFTSNNGQTFAPRELPLTASLKGGGIVATDVPGLMLAAAGNMLIRSTDAGCTWFLLDTLADAEQYRAAKATGDRVWFYESGGRNLYVVDGESGTVTAVQVPGAVAAVYGLSMAFDDPNRAQFTDSFGRVHLSNDLGVVWTAVGTAPPATTPPLSAAFGPGDAATVIVGFTDEGVQFSADKGASWAMAIGLSQLGGSDIAVHQLVYSSADPNFAWAMGIVEAEALEPHGGMHIYRSTNGGANWEEVLDHVNGTAPLNERIVLAPHPTDSNILYMGYGTRTQEFGMNLYRYQHIGGGLTQQHTDDLHGVGGIAFHPANAQLLYVTFVYDDVPL